MREIKFRGRSFDGSFIYGDLVHRAEGICIQSLSCADGCSVQIRITTQVNPETVGQYTGLKDKKGTKIYEGDILDDKTIVMFGIVDIDDNEMYSSNQVCGFYRKSLNNEYYHMDLQDYDRVIGNIHENKELFEG